MDIPIHLTYKLEEEQNTFLGHVPNENLLPICNEATTIPGHAVNFIISTNGSKAQFLENENRYHANTNITSHFLASFLDLKEARVDIFLLLRKTFKVEYLGDDIDIVAHVELGVGIP